MQEKSDTAKAFAARVAQLRSKHKGSMAAVARAMHVSRTAIYDAQKGTVPVSDKMLRLLREAEDAFVTVEEEEQAAYGSKETESLARSPLRAAALAADKLPGTLEDRQLGFEQYVRQIQQLRAEAEALAGKDKEMAMGIFDRLIAAWLARHDMPKAKKKKQTKAEKFGLAKITPKPEILEQQTSPSRHARPA